MGIAGVEERAVTIGGTKDQQIKAGELIFGLMQETIQTSTYKNMSTNYGHQQQPEYVPRQPAYSSYPPPQYRAYGSRYSPAPATSPRIPLGWQRRQGHYRNAIAKRCQNSDLQSGTNG